MGVAVILVQFFLPFKKVTGNWREKIGKIDYIGSILVLASTTLILLPLNWLVELFSFVITQINLKIGEGINLLGIVLWL